MKKGDIQMTETIYTREGHCISKIDIHYTNDKNKELMNRFLITMVELLDQLYKEVLND